MSQNLSKNEDRPPSGDFSEPRGSYVDEMIRERKFTDRLLDAMQSMRSDKAALTSLGVASIVHERKAAPDLGQHAPSPLNNWRFTGWGWNRNTSLSRVNHKAEVGDLDLNSLAMAVVNFTAMRIPEARPCVVRRKQNGDEERDFTHPAAKLIRRPNRHNIWADYAAACSMSWWLNGNVYFLIVRNEVTGEILELYYLPHFLVSPRWPNDGRSPAVPVEADTDPVLSHYQYDVPGKAPVLYPAKDIIHLKRGVDLSNPRLGLGAFESLYKELYGDDRMALFTASIMKNMGLQVPIISPKDDQGVIDDKDAAAMRETWMAKTTGDRAGEPVIMTAPVDVEKFGFSPTELDMSTNRLISEARVCAVCQISPAALQLMVGVQNGTSYASSEQARQQGYEEVIIPIQQVWAENFNWQLLPEFEDTQDAEFEFDVSNVRVLQEDRDAQYKRETSLLSAGGQTINECRQVLGKKPAGPEGDVYLIPGLSSPTTPEQLLAKADGSLAPEPTPQPIDPASLAKFADLERWFEGLENQMKGFVR